VLVSGGLVAFPTETVYGLGANALDAAAVEAIFRAKGRPATDPVIVHLASVEQVHDVARRVPAIAYDLARAFWPGALTLILEKQPCLPPSVTAGLPTVGVRVPAHPVAHQLIARAGVPVAAPSANRFSRPSPTRAVHVLADLDGVIDLVIDGGPASIGVESTILDLTVSPPVIRRWGGVTLSHIQHILPEATALAEFFGDHDVHLAPGQSLRHYAPRAALTLYIGQVDDIALRVGADVRAAVAAGSRVGVLSPEEDLMALAPRLAALGRTGRVVTMRYGARRKLDESAHELFLALRALDAEGVDLILASAPEADGIGLAITDRLTRAAEGRVVRLHR
nr:threonylcarbamoyl-AMP synthase [Acidobacteriota bacterium]